MPHPFTPRRTLAALALVPLLALTACGDDDDTDTSTGDTTAETAAPTTAADDAPTSAPDDTTAPDSEPPATAEVPDVPATVTIGLGTTEYGSVLTAPDGKTLYVFDNDEGGVPTCVDAECAEKWPAVLAASAELAAGAPEEAIELGTTERPDGTTQVTVNGLPVYTMAIDEPGEALCQGGDDVWWVMGADGEVNRSLEPTAT